MRSLLRFHIPLVESALRISRIRLSDGHLLQAHAVCSAQAASLETQACSGIASSFFGGDRLSPLLRPVSPSRACPKSDPAWRVLRACPPPHPAQPVPHGLPVGVLAPPVGPPVLRRTSLYTCRRHYPGGTVGSARCYLLQRRRSSSKFSRVGSRIASFEGSVHFALRPAYSPSRLATLYTEGFGKIVASFPLRLLPPEASLVGWDSHPRRVRAFSRRTELKNANSLLRKFLIAEVP